MKTELLQFLLIFSHHTTNISNFFISDLEFCYTIIDHGHNICNPCTKNEFQLSFSLKVTSWIKIHIPGIWLWLICIHPRSLHTFSSSIFMASVNFQDPSTKTFSLHDIFDLDITVIIIYICTLHIASVSRTSQSSHETICWSIMKIRDTWITGNEHWTRQW